MSEEESEEPERNFVVGTSEVGIVACHYGSGIRLHTLVAVAYADVDIAVHTIGTFALALVDSMVTPEGVDEEGLHGLLLVDVGAVDGVDEVGVVQEHSARFSPVSSPIFRKTIR